MSRVIVSSQGRWLVASLRIPSGTAAESILTGNVLPWFLERRNEIPELRFSYSINAASPGLDSLALGVCVRAPGELAGRLPAVKESFESQLGEWTKQRAILRGNCTFRDMESELKGMGGPVGAALLEDVDSEVSLALADYASAAGSLDKVPRRTARSIALTHVLLSWAAAGDSAEGAARLLEKRCEDLFETLGNARWEMLREAASKVGPSVGLALENAAKLETEEPWGRALQRVRKELSSKAPVLLQARKLIEDSVQWHDWVGRRILHLNFCRFHIDSYSEVSLLLALAQEIREREAAWAS